MGSLLIIDSDDQWRNFLADALAGLHAISYCAAGRDIIKKVKLVHFDMVLLDLEDGDPQLLRVLAEVKELLPYTPVVVTCRCEKADLVVSAMKQGAFDFIVKPYSTAKVTAALEKALEHVSLRNEINCLRREQDVIYDLSKIIAVSQSMQRVIADVRKFSLTDSTILMSGETGTGKSLLAGAIHYNSMRRGKPFVTINCANIQETLLESELFGHERGAFTGADKLRIGRFEQANGGTIFLDEIGEMSLALQAKLLRVIEQKAFERVGSNCTIHVDVRIIAATNRDLDALVAEGRFRDDLFYRLNVLPIRLPPLRERQECLVPLAQYLLDKIGRSLHKYVAGFSDPVLAAIATYSWPGNIRQLANTIERSVLLEDSDEVRPENFLLPERPYKPFAETSPPPINASGRLCLADSEKEAVVAALNKTLWIQKDAAILLGISPRVLNHKIKKFGITHPRWRRHR